jgi:type II secretory pathway predicted ATPase ExeA
VIRRCEIAELQPLDGNVREYLALKFERAGKKVEDIFTEDAFTAIVRASRATRSRGRRSRWSTRSSSTTWSPRR